MAGYTSWFLGLGTTASPVAQCTTPQVDREAIESVATNASFNPFWGSREDETTRNDVHLALHRTHAKCKILVQALEDRLNEKIEEIMHTLGEHGELLTGVTVQSARGRGSEGVLGDPLTASSTASPTQLQLPGSGFRISQIDAIPDLMLEKLKADLQALVDGMRVQILNQQSSIAELGTAVQELTINGPRKDNHRQVRNFNWDYESPSQTSPAVGSGNYASLAHFDQLELHLSELRQEMHNMKKTGGGAGSEAGVASKADLDKIVTEVGKQFDEMNKELQHIRDTQELTAVKAGFLAVAATECNHEEKDHLFQTLKEQEETFFKKHHGKKSNQSGPAITNVSM